MFHASRSPPRQTYGPGICLAHEVYPFFPSGTYKLLTVLIVDVGVAFHGIQSRALVNLGQEAIQWAEDTPGLDELIEVSRDDDVCILIQGEDRVYELLEQDEPPPEKTKHKQIYTPRQL